MNELKKRLSGVCLATLAGWVGTVALAVVLHSLGFASPAAEQGYPYTSYLQNCVNPGSAIVYCALAVVLGCLLRKPWPLAAGMMLPWPLACVVEIVRDPTSHNLLPFEPFIAWLPAFSLAVMGAYVGKWVFGRFSGDDEPERLDLSGQNGK